MCKVVTDDRIKSEQFKQGINRNFFFFQNTVCKMPTFKASMFVITAFLKCFVR